MDDELLERMLDELGAIEEELRAIDEDEELGAILERTLLATLLRLLTVPPKLVANFEVALIPLALLIR